MFLLRDALPRPTFPPITLHQLCTFLLIVASPRRSALAAPIPESDDHVEMTTLDQLRKYVICDLTTNTHTQPNQH